MELRENNSINHKKYIKEPLNEVGATDPNFVDNLKDDIISYSYKNSSSLVQSSEGDFNENYYVNFMNDIFGNEEHLTRSLCVSPPNKPKTTNKIISNKQYLSHCKKKESRRSFFNGKVRFKQKFKSPEKINKRSRFISQNDSCLNKNEMILLSDNNLKSDKEKEIMKENKKNKNKKNNSKKDIKVYKNNINNSNVQNGNTNELSTKQYKYIFEEEKKKNFLCCIKC